MAKPMKMEEIGGYAFIAGVLIAVVASFISLDATLVTEALVVLGILVGLINVSDKESKDFLLAAVALVLVSSLAGTGFGSVPIVGVYLQKALMGIMTFVTPAVIVVALKQVYSVAKDV